jgi:Cu/Ag efflux protein CusF
MNMFSIVFAVFLFGGSLGVMAATDNTKPAAGVPAASADSAAMTEAEVRKVDKDAKKITLKHGEIKNLEMPAMTMVFQVKDGKLLDAAKAGDKVKFRAEKVSGGIVVTAIEVTK